MRCAALVVVVVRGGVVVCEGKLQADMMIEIARLFLLVLHTLPRTSRGQHSVSNCYIIPQAAVNPRPCLAHEAVATGTWFGFFSLTFWFGRQPPTPRPNLPFWFGLPPFPLSFGLWCRATFATFYTFAQSLSLRGALPTAPIP